MSKRSSSSDCRFRNEEKRKTSQTEERDFKQLLDSVSDLNISLSDNDNEKFIEFLTNYIKENKKIVQTSKIIILKNFKRNLSQNNLNEIDLTESIKCILAENHNCNDDQNNNCTINSFLKQNIELKDDIIKIMMIGCSKIGKTSLINHFIENTGDDVYCPTIGMEIKKANVKILDKNMRIEFIDTDKDIHQKEITRSINLNKHSLIQNL